MLPIFTLECNLLGPADMEVSSEEVPLFPLSPLPIRHSPYTMSGEIAVRQHSRLPTWGHSTSTDPRNSAPIRTARWLMSQHEKRFAASAPQQHRLKTTPPTSLPDEGGNDPETARTRSNSIATVQEEQRRHHAVALLNPTSTEFHHFCHPPHNWSLTVTNHHRASVSNRLCPGYFLFFGTTLVWKYKEVPPSGCGGM